MPLVEEAACRTLLTTTYNWESCRERKRKRNREREIVDFDLYRERKRVASREREREWEKKPEKKTSIWWKGLSNAWKQTSDLETGLSTPEIES